MVVKNFIIIFPFSDARHDGYVLVEHARDLEQVKQYADHVYDNYAIYHEADFTDEGYYPKGCIETVNLRTWHDYVT